MKTQTSQIASPGAAEGSRTIDIDFLYLDLEKCARCRGSSANLDAAVEETRELLEDVSIEVVVRRTVVESEQQAAHLDFVSSPTIRIHGSDVAKDLAESRCDCCGELCGCLGGINCRDWIWRGGRYTLAPKEMIKEAILRAALALPAGYSPSQKRPTEGREIPENLKRFFAGRDQASMAKTSRGTRQAAACCGQECC